MAEADLLDEHGNPLPSNGNAQDLANGTTTPSGNGGGNTPNFNASSVVNDIFSKAGITPGETDAANLAGKNPEDRAQFIADLTRQAQERAAPTATAGGKGGDADLDRNGQIDPGWKQTTGGQYQWAGAGPAPSVRNTPTGYLPTAAQLTARGGTQQGVPNVPNTTPQFTDPSQRLLEDYALNRFQQLQNPDPNSGTALYEQYAKTLAQSLQGPAYSDADEAVLKTKAFDMLEQDRTATKQRWMEEISRRGIAPSSGIALSGFQHIDGEYDKARASVTNSFASTAIDQTRTNKMNALAVLNNLQGSENSRLNGALNFARVPYDLGTDSFNQNMQLVNAGGSPAANAQSALQLATAIQNNQNLSAQQRATYMAQIMEWVGSL